MNGLSFLDNKKELEMTAIHLDSTVEKQKGEGGSKNGEGGPKKGADVSGSKRSCMEEESGGIVVPSKRGKGGGHGEKGGCQVRVVGNGQGDCEGREKREGANKAGHKSLGGKGRGEDRVDNIVEERGKESFFVK